MRTRRAFVLIESESMQNSLLNFLAVLAACFICTGAAMAEDHVHATLVADASAIQSGVPFILGIKFKIVSGYHIYWKNPGDSGIATDVKLTLPDGFTAGEVLYPVPHREESPGPVVSYVYEDEVMLMVRVTPPKDLPPGKSVALAGKASWLVCKEECVPGSAEISLELPVAAAAAPANADLFDRWAKQLPLKEDPADVASSSNALAITNGNGSASVTVNWKNLPNDIQFLPGPMADGFAENVKVTTVGNASTISFDVKGFKGNAPITGLVTFKTTAGVMTGIEISVPSGGKP